MVSGCYIALNINNWSLMVQHHYFYCIAGIFSSIGITVNTDSLPADAVMKSVIPHNGRDAYAYIRACIVHTCLHCECKGKHSLKVELP